MAGRRLGGRTVGTGIGLPTSSWVPPATAPTLSLHPLKVPSELEERHREQQREERVGEGGGVPHPEVAEGLYPQVVGDGGGRAARSGGAAVRHHEDLLESLHPPDRLDHQQEERC